MGLDVIFFAIFTELITIELSAVVHDKGIRYPKPGGDILMYEGLHILLGDSG